MNNNDLPVIQQTDVRVTLAPGRTKHIHLPHVDDPVPMGMHGAVAEHYRVEEGTYEPHATTIDYLIGATAGCLAGTFAGRLAALGQPTDDEHLKIEATGDIVKDGTVLKLDSIRVTYGVKRADEVPVEKIERALEQHQKFCPIARSIGSAVQLITRVEYLDAPLN